MRIAYRQGLISAQDSFLLKDLSGDRYIDIIVNPTPVTAAVAVGDTDYLIVEQRSVSNAWGPFYGPDTRYLYWEINQANGIVTRSFTTLSPVTSPNPPAEVIDQMWWDTSSNLMKVFNGSRWVNTLRVLAGELRFGSTVIPAPFESQVGLNTPTDAGTIMSDGLGGAFKNSKGEFLTTNTDLSSVDTGSLVKLDGAQIVLQANENIPKFSLVYILNGRAALASGQAPDEITKAPIGLITVDAYQNDAVTLVTGGKSVTNEQWNWSASEIGKKVYCTSTGTVTLVEPNLHKKTIVGIIVGTQSILLLFSTDTDIVTSSGLSGVGTTLPLSISGSSDFPIIGINKADDSTDGYISAADIARITSIENILSNKSDVGHPHPEKSNIDHMHIIADTTDLQTALNDKSNVGHGHIITDTSGLQTALDNKADISHGHSIPEVSGLQSALDNKADLSHSHIIADTTGLQTTLNGKSDIGHGHSIPEVAGLQSSLDDKSFVGHGHVINNIAGLQTALNDKSDVGHWHVIADTTGLQDALDGKANVVHGHIIAAVIGLQDALDGKANVSHTHALSGLTDTNIILPSTNQVLTFNGLKWVNSAVPSGNGTAAIFHLQIGIPSGTHSHSAIITLNDLTLAMAANDGTSQTYTFVISSDDVAGHMHDITIVYDYASGLLVIDSISNNAIDNHVALPATFIQQTTPYLEDLGDVDLFVLPNGNSTAGPFEGDVLTWNNAQQRWISTAPAPSSGGGSSIIYCDWETTGDQYLPTYGSESSAPSLQATNPIPNALWTGASNLNPAGIIEVIDGDGNVGFYPGDDGLYMVQVNLRISNYNSFAYGALSALKFKLVAVGGNSSLDGPEQTEIIYGKDFYGSFSKSLTFTHYMRSGNAYKLAIWQDSEVGNFLIVGASSSVRFIKLLSLAPFIGP
jgi:hypothetical protein